MNDSLRQYIVIVSIAASGLVLPACATSALGEDRADAWCRLDDPGWSEQQRQDRDLDRLALSRLSCPRPGDPQTRPEELILPMPCGRAMVFRRVMLSLDNILARHEAFLGSVPRTENENKPSRLAVEGPRRSFISASLGMSKDRGAPHGFGRGFYIGKYEVTELQYDAYRLGLFNREIDTSPGSPVCRQLLERAAKMPGTLVLPATGMTWFDAVSYSRAYMEWLLAQDRQAISQRQPLSLPWEESAPSFLRLPTSDEWEYAARGGNVGSGDQSARTYLIESQGRRQADLHEVASLIDEQTPPPEGSEVMYIGRKKPNLIGIYDTIGNAAEMVLDLFQAIRPDQQLGPPGGYIVMGGNAGQDSKSISVGSRQEVQYYDRDGPVRSPVNGFRLLVSAPFTFNAANEEREPLAGNPRLDEQINAAYSKLVEPTGAGAEERLAAKNEVSRIKEDAARVQESGDDARKLAQDLQVRLQSVLADLDRSTAELNVREAAVRSERFRSLVLAASNMNMVSRIYAQTRRTMAELEALTARLTDPQQVAANKSKIKDIKDNRVPRLRASYCSNLRYYLESVIELSSAEPRDAAGAARRVGDQFRLQVGDFYADFQRLSEQHIEAARAARQVIGHAAETAWRKQIDRGFWDADAPATKFQGFGGEEKPC